MKIVNIVPGFGGTFYCGNCLRDSVFVKTLQTMGHQVVMLPIYMPLTVDNGTFNSETPVFYGAVNIYLKQNFSLFRHEPAWLQKFFDSKPILKYAARKAGSTRAEGLEEMTISMLKGEDGLQREELHELVEYLKYHEKTDLVHLSNALLMGLAKKIREELKIPVVCSLQDEDVWIDAMRPSYKEGLWRLMAEKGKDIDAFIGVSQYFSGVMMRKMAIPADKIHVVHIGVNPSDYQVHVPNTDAPVIGYLSRMCEENGFEILVDAFIQLKQNPRFAHVRLKLNGGSTGDDKKFIQKQIKKLKQNGFLHDVVFASAFNTSSLSEYFSDVTVMSVPVLKGEAFGLYQLEAMASGIPVVQPALGAFPEVAELTGGGFIYEPNTAKALAKAFEDILSNPDRLLKFSKAGRKAVEEHFNTAIITQKMVEVYEKLLLS